MKSISDLVLIIGLSDKSMTNLDDIPLELWESLMIIGQFGDVPYDCVIEKAQSII